MYKKKNLENRALNVPVYSISLSANSNSISSNIEQLLTNRESLAEFLSEIACLFYW